jgi:hypothetical protein
VEVVGSSPAMPTKMLVTAAFLCRPGRIPSPSVGEDDV